MSSLPLTNTNMDDQIRNCIQRLEEIGDDRLPFVRRLLLDLGNDKPDTCIFWDKDNFDIDISWNQCLTIRIEKNHGVDIFDDLGNNDWFKKYDESTYQIIQKLYNRVFNKVNITHTTTTTTTQSSST
jgi:hypothetical protein